jgi:hypothetical protein
MKEKEILRVCVRTGQWLKWLYNENKNPDNSAAIDISTNNNIYK